MGLMRYVIGMLLLCGLLAVPGFAQGAVPAVKTVLAKGTGAGEDRAKARDEALQDAQRRAVEQGVGLFVKSETMVANLTLLSDTIYTKAAGYVRTYKVVQENYNADKSLYWVMIEAEVAAGQIEDDLDTLWERLKLAANPRVIVDITPDAQDESGLAGTALTARLVELGFAVYDAAQVQAVKEREALKLLRDGHADAAAPRGAGARCRPARRRGPDHLQRPRIAGGSHHPHRHRTDHRGHPRRQRRRRLRGRCRLYRGAGVRRQGLAGQEPEGPAARGARPLPRLPRDGHWLQL